MELIFEYMGYEFEFIRFSPDTHTVIANHIDSDSAKEIPFESLSSGYQDFLRDTFPEYFL